MPLVLILDSSSLQQKICHSHSDSQLQIQLGSYDLLELDSGVAVTVSFIALNLTIEHHHSFEYCSSVCLQISPERSKIKV